MAGMETLPWPSVNEDEPILTTMRRANRSLVRSVTGLGVAKLGVDTGGLSSRRWFRPSTTRSVVLLPFRRELRRERPCARRILGVFLHGWVADGLQVGRLGRAVRPDVRPRWSSLVPNQRPLRSHHHR